MTRSNQPERAVRICAAIAATVGAAVVSSPATAQQYEVTLLEPMGGFQGGVLGVSMNEAGQIVGGHRTLEGVYLPLRWNPNGVPTPLPPLVADIDTFALDINDGGLIVGYGLAAEGDPRAESRAVRWRDGQLEPLGVLPGASASEAHVVNNLGVVGGLHWYFEPASRQWTYKATLWREGEGWSLIPDDDSFSSQILDLNDAGDLVMRSFISPGVPQLTLWRNGTRIVLDQDLSEIWGMNQQGVIFGVRRSIIQAREAAIWDDGLVTHLGFLGNALFGLRSSAATAMNNLGQVAGVSTARGQTEVPFLLENEVMVDLDLLHSEAGVILQGVLDLNDAGTMLTEGWFGGTYRTFITRKIEHSIVLGNPQPGRAGEVNTITATGITPSHRVWLAAGRETGGPARNGALVPGCGDLMVNIRYPQVIASVSADAAGVATVRLPVNPNLAGQPAFLIAIDPAACEISNLVTWRFAE